MKPTPMPPSLLVQLGTVLVLTVPFWGALLLTKPWRPRRPSRLRRRR